MTFERDLFINLSLRKEKMKNAKQYFTFINKIKEANNSLSNKPLANLRKGDSFYIIIKIALFFLESYDFIEMILSLVAPHIIILLP